MISFELIFPSYFNYFFLSKKLWRIIAAATLSTTFLFSRAPFLLLSFRSLSADTVVNLSSTSNISNPSIFLFSFSINSLTFSACLFSVPSRLFGIPITRDFVFSWVSISSILFTAFTFLLSITSRGVAYIPIISDLATPILTSPTSKAIYFLNICTP